MKTKKTINTIKPEIRKQIELDICACEHAISLALDDLELYTELKARYTLLDRNFYVDMPSFSNSLKKIEYAKARLETYLLLDAIPVQYNQNVAVGVNIQTQKLVNKGNIGNNNNYNKSTTVTTELSVNGGENKKSFWGKLFHKK
jgi:hypothetical protein